jgi:hypothetical protein
MEEDLHHLDEAHGSKGISTIIGIYSKIKLFRR